MKKVILGSTGIEAIQNGFGCLPIQRISEEESSYLLRKAYNNGIRFFDTARYYTDSEEKIGKAFEGIDRSSYYLTTKTQTKTVEGFWEELNTSLKNLKTDYIDVYQFHMAPVCFKPGDGTGLYEAMLEAKEKGLIKHIGITTHMYKVAKDVIESGLYETLQYPFSYIADKIDYEIVDGCKKANMGFIAMKGLAGGLLTNSQACMAFMSQYDHVMPIWGIQKESELDEWLSYNMNTPVFDEEMKNFIESDKATFGKDFCRGCGYCLPCSVGIEINNAARMSQLIRRSPSAGYMGEEWQAKMKLIESCIDCGACMSRCPYELNTPLLLRKNYEDYKKIISGEIKVM